MKKSVQKHIEKIAPKGHNRVGGVAAEELKSIIARIEKLVEEKQAIQGDISDVFAEAKGRGYDCKTIRQILKIRQKDPQEREEEETVLDVYMHALGMLPDFEDGREDLDEAESDE